MLEHAMNETLHRTILAAVCLSLSAGCNSDSGLDSGDLKVTRPKRDSGTEADAALRFLVSAADASARDSSDSEANREDASVTHGDPADKDAGSTSASANGLVTSNSHRDAGSEKTPIAESHLPDDGGISGEAGPVGECQTNAECIDQNDGAPFICRANKCIALTDPEECPVIMGGGDNLENLRDAEPIIFGAYSYINPLSPLSTSYTKNYYLAIEEVNQALQENVEDARPFVAVLCRFNSTEADFDVSLDLLINDLGVSGIISAMLVEDLRSAFETRGLPSHTFFLDPGAPSAELVNLEDDGLLWHILGNPSDVGDGYAALLTRTEQYLRTELALGDEPIRVALIDSDKSNYADMAERLFEVGSFNGMTLGENLEQGNFVRLRNPTEYATIVAANDILLEFDPHIVIAITSRSFTSGLFPLLADPQLQALFQEQRTMQDGGAGSSGTDQATASFFLLSPEHKNDPNMLDLVSSLELESRTMGINWAAAADSTLYDAYLLRLQDMFGIDAPVSTENFYDVGYYLMYSLISAYAATPEPTGLDVRQGMLRLIGGPQAFNVGPADVAAVHKLLTNSQESTLTLMGAMGPPDFDRSTGARYGASSVYCFPPAAHDVALDVLRYDPDRNTLVGEQPCIEGF